MTNISELQRLFAEEVIFELFEDPTSIDDKEPPLIELLFKPKG